LYFKVYVNVPLRQCLYALPAISNCDFMKRLIFAFAALLLVFGCLGTSGGRLVVTITDPAGDAGDITSVKVTVDSVSVHSSEKGWETISTTQHTYDLLQLKSQGAKALLADMQLQPGTFQQIRLNISKVVVTDSTGDHDADLPSGELKVVGGITIKENSTTVAVFDFDASKSIKTTGAGKYVMSPVVKFQTIEDAQVEMKGNNRVEVKGGTTNTSVTVGE